MVQGGGDADLRSAMRAMEDELRTTKLGESMRPRNPSEDEGEDEFDDVEDFAPVKVGYGFWVHSLIISMNQEINFTLY